MKDVTANRDHFQTPSITRTGRKEEQDETTQNNRSLGRESNPGHSENQWSSINSWRTGTMHSARQSGMDQTTSGWQGEGQRQRRTHAHAHHCSIISSTLRFYVLHPSLFIFIFVVLHGSIFGTTRKQINPSRTPCYHFLHYLYPLNLKTAAGKTMGSADT